MYQIIHDVITSKRYELNDILKKIDAIWLQGDIDDDQKDELVEMAQENVDPENSYAPLQDQINDLYNQLKAMGARIDALETGETPEPTPEPEEWPEWYRWLGIGPNPWQNGSKCTHNGKKWVSQVDNNIWEPGSRGVYDNIWKEYTE